MPWLTKTLAHHSEPIDPALWDWLSAQINHLIGISSGVMVALFGALIIVLPIAILVMARRRF
tara:strand:+ start:2073 stop:2258 length:186 start_codon:yes stop_codon:yes gene_type:complete